MNAEQILDNILIKMTVPPGAPLSETIKSYQTTLDFIEQCLKEEFDKGKKAGQTKRWDNLKSQN